MNMPNIIYQMPLQAGFTFQVLMQFVRFGNVAPRVRAYRLYFMIVPFSATSFLEFVGCQHVVSRCIYAQLSGVGLPIWHVWGTTILNLYLLGTTSLTRHEHAQTCLTHAYLDLLVLVWHMCRDICKKRQAMPPLTFKIFFFFLAP